jgi:hypothetical protein
LTFFLTPPEFCRQNKVLKQFCTSIFCQNPGIFQKFFFVPSKTSAFWQKVWRILLEKGENYKFFKNFACKPWFWGLRGKKVARIQAFFSPPSEIL